PVVDKRVCHPKTIESVPPRRALSYRYNKMESRLDGCCGIGDFEVMHLLLQLCNHRSLWILAEHAHLLRERIPVVHNYPVVWKQGIWKWNDSKRRRWRDLRSVGRISGRTSAGWPGRFPDGLVPRNRIGASSLKR